MKNQDPDPDPLVRGTDPRIRIRTKMLRIRNTGDKDDRRADCWGVLAVSGGMDDVSHGAIIGTVRYVFVTKCSWTVSSAHSQWSR